jgi:hypothetical protein
MKKWPSTAIERAASAAAIVPNPTLQPGLGIVTCCGTSAASLFGWQSQVPDPDLEQVQFIESSSMDGPYETTCSWLDGEPGRMPVQPIVRRRPVPPAHYPTWIDVQRVRAYTPRA